MRFFAAASLLLATAASVAVPDFEELEKRQGNDTAPVSLVLKLELLFHDLLSKQCGWRNRSHLPLRTQLHANSLIFSTDFLTTLLSRLGYVSTELWSVSRHRVPRRVCSLRRGWRSILPNQSAQVSITMGGYERGR